MLRDNIMIHPLNLAASARRRGFYAMAVLALLWGAIAWAMSA